MTALILAAHGSSTGSGASTVVRRLADRLAAGTSFDEVVPTFYKEPPYFAEVLDTVRSSTVIVVPILATTGWYADVVLPRELDVDGPITRRDGRVIYLTKAVGEHPSIIDRIGQLGRRAVDSCQFDLAETALVLVGHGTPRYPGAAKTVNGHVACLRSKSSFGQVEAVFLEQDPRIEQVYDVTRLPNLVVTPFLIGGGRHATSDLRGRLGFPHADVGDPALPSRVEDRQVVLTETPFDSATLAEVVELLADEVAGSSVVRAVDRVEAPSAEGG
ncbi:MAG: hypothetical protein GY778_09265 [bacterium]|nr:hypothetical protein [bacterium]